MQTVLITGCDSGIGREFARQYAAEGWRTIATYLDLGNRVPAAEGGERMEHHALDVTDPNDFADLKRAVATAPIDLLLSNAGIGRDTRPFGDLDYDYARRMLEVNTLGPLRLAETFADNVAASGLKRMAFVSSRMGSIGLNLSGGHYGYRASKAGLNAIVRSLAIDLFPRGIKTVALHPGGVATPGTEGPLTAEEAVRRMRDLIRRLGLHDTGQFYAYDGTPLPW
jgi:NAD(P)-dependent dehydrogenase (short-subunit alcohol dehydrogenase family)